MNDAGSATRDARPWRAATAACGFADQGARELRAAQFRTGGSAKPQAATSPKSRRGAPRLLVSLSPCLPLLLLALLPGCIGAPANPAATRPTTRVAVETGRSQYWYNRPAVVAVASPEFDPLWDAGQRAMRDAGFVPDRLEPRDGVVTSQPLISKQPFEFWRNDINTAGELAKSTIATMRRTVRLDIAKQPDGAYDLVPRVLVERYSLVEHRVTSVTQYREVFALTREEQSRKQDLLRDPLIASQEGGLPAEYFYAVGRDEPLERMLAKAVADRLGGKGNVIAPPATLPTDRAGT